MNNLPQLDQSPKDDDYNRLLVESTCERLLNVRIPHFFKIASLARKVVSSELEQTGLSKDIEASKFIVNDQTTDQIISYKIRLIVREPLLGFSFRGEGEVKALAINVPEPFIVDPEYINGVSMFLATLTVAQNGEEHELRYVVTEEGITPYTAFEDLDFMFKDHDSTDQTTDNTPLLENINEDNDGNEDGCKDCPPRLLDINGNPYQTIPIEEQLNISSLFYQIMMPGGKYVLGRMSRREDTM